MDALKSLKNTCESHRLDSNWCLRRIFAIHWIIFRLFACTGLVCLVVFLSTFFILSTKTNDTHCKFFESGLICIPHAEQTEWFSFHRISQITYTRSLKQLLVDNDNLKALDLHAFEQNVLLHAPSLQHLVIREAKISYIPNLEFNSNLIHFNASYNEIERVNAFEFSGTDLYSLDLSCNKINYIHENAFNVRLKIGQTSIVGLNLTEIYLNNNRLTRALPEWFQNLKKLKKIDLRYNLIAAIGTDFFNKLKALNHLRFDSFIIVDGVIKRDDDKNYLGPA